MNSELPTPILELAESLGARLVTDRSEVSDIEIIVVVHYSHPARANTPSNLLFVFPDDSKRQQFRDKVFLSYGDPKIFEPWKTQGYFSQPAGDYFRGSGGGSSGSSQPSMSLNGGINERITKK